jgi:alpha-tubulin suppressor-like RCC1 family protein
LVLSLKVLDYEVYGCGWNENGQAGVGVSKIVLIPQAIPPLRFAESKDEKEKNEEQCNSRYKHK